MDALIKAPPPKVYKHPEADWDLFRAHGWGEEAWYNKQEGREWGNPSGRREVPKLTAKTTGSEKGSEKGPMREPANDTIIDQVITELVDALEDRLTQEEHTFDFAMVDDKYEHLQVLIDYCTENISDTMKIGDRDAHCDVATFMELMALPLLAIRFTDDEPTTKEEVGKYLEEIWYNLQELLHEVENDMGTRSLSAIALLCEQEGAPIIDVLYADYAEGAYGRLVGEDNE